MPQDTNFTGVIPYINVDDAPAAIAFYKKVFNAKELMLMPADDGKRVMHCHLEINGGGLMVASTFPEHGHDFQPSHSFMMMLVVDDADTWWKSAVDAGCEITHPLQEMFWGDRYGTVRDPYNVNWGFNQPATPV